MLRSLSRRLAAAALLLPLLALAIATDGMWLRCRMTGEIQSSACCCPGDAEAAAPQTPTISEAACCDRLERHVVPTVAELRSTAAVAQAAADASCIAVEVTTLEPVATPAPARRAERSSAGPSTARLRLLAKHSLLI